MLQHAFPPPWMREGLTLTNSVDEAERLREVKHHAQDLVVNPEVSSRWKRQRASLHMLSLSGPLWRGCCHIS